MAQALRGTSKDLVGILPHENFEQDDWTEEIKTTAFSSLKTSIALATDSCGQIITSMKKKFTRFCSVTKWVLLSSQVRWVKSCEIMLHQGTRGWWWLYSNYIGKGHWKEVALVTQLLFSASLKQKHYKDGSSCLCNNLHFLTDITEEVNTVFPLAWRTLNNFYLFRHCPDNRNLHMNCFLTFRHFIL